MTSSADDFTIRFWGVRGSIPTPDQDKLIYGGHTPCVSFQFGAETPIILDAGTGILPCGEQLCGASNNLHASVLLSHFHWDHIQGFPFLAQLYSRQSQIRLFSTFTPQVLEDALRGQMQEPYFPIPYSAIQAHLQYEQIPEEGLQIGSVHIRAIHLNHPGGCSGFRLDTPAGSAVYASDHEHGLSTIDAQLIDLASEVDVFIPDAHFTPAEYQSHKGWGHSTWLDSCNLADKARARRVLLFHHSPSRTDSDMQTLVEQARQHFPDVDAARDGAKVVLSRPKEESCRC